MQKILCVLACLITLNTAIADDSAFIAPLASESVLLDIETSNYVVAVGERGHVLLSENGEQYVQLNIPTQSTLTSVAISGDKIWAAGHDAVIIHSNDRGQTWAVQFYSPEMERPFLDLVFFDDSHGIAVGAYGLFYRTRDGGNSWQSERHAELLSAEDQEYLEELRQESEEFYLQELDSILPHFNRLSVNGDELLMAGETGLIATSMDKGETWSRLDSNYYGSFFDIKAISPPSQQYLAVGLRGNAYYSVDGKQWTPVQTCSESTLNSLIQVSEQELLAVGNNGALVSISLPLDSAISARKSQCADLSAISASQFPGKTALVGLSTFDNKVLSATAEGVKTLTDN